MSLISGRFFVGAFARKYLILFTCNRSSAIEVDQDGFSHLHSQETAISSVAALNTLVSSSAFPASVWKDS